MISVFSLSLIILENTLAAVEGRPAATDGQQFLKDVAAGSEMSDKPGYLQFTAPYMLCDGDCTVDEEYNFVMSFPLFVGKFGKDKYKKMFSQDYKKIHSKNSEAPFKTRTTKVYTLCKRGSTTVKSTKGISKKNIARSKRTTITKTTKRPNIKHHITKKFTTVKATTKEVTTDEPTTKEVTTDEPTTKELTTDEPTTKEVPTEEATTGKATKKKATTKKATTKKATTKKSTTKKATTKKSTTKKATTKKATTKKATTKKVTTKKATTKKATTKELTTDEPTKEVPTEEATTEEVTTEEATTNKELTTDDPTKEVTTEEATTEEATTEEATTEEPTTKDLTTEDLTVEEPITDILILTLPEPTESFVTPSTKDEHPTTPLYPNVSKKMCPKILPGMCVRRTKPDMWYTEDDDYLFTQPEYDTPRIVNLQYYKRNKAIGTYTQLPYIY